MRSEVIVIGNGVMGSTIASWLRLKGREVLTLDDGRPESGTSASGGLIKPSKLNGLTPVEEAEVRGVLDPLFGLTREVFTIRPSFDLVKTEIWRINMDRVRTAPSTKFKVTEIKRGEAGEDSIVLGEGAEGPEEHRCGILILAAGYWCMELLPEIFPPGSLTAKKGVSFRFKGKIDRPFVKMWAPYKQVTVHNTDYMDEKVIWAGDGTGLKLENWREGIEAECLVRIRKEFPDGEAMIPFAETPGLRPFHKDKDRPCFVKEAYPRVWVATGAGKFGGISAAWAARKIERELV